MKPLLTAVSLVLAISPPLTYAATADLKETDVIGSQLITEPQATIPSKSVPEPNSLVALAFAGVVILARHRFRPS